jgi:(2Fe-2S) ferredoxin
MPSLKRHVFVCVNERAPDNPKGCCLHRGAAAVREQFKKQLAERGLRGQVRANNAGCLDQCAHGVTVLVYPEQVWYGHVTAEDVSEIIERHIIGGEFVTRLMLPGQPHLGNAVRAEPLAAAAQEGSDPEPPGR